MDKEKTLGVFPLTMFAVGTTLASGVFSLSGDFAAGGAHTLATLLGWAVAGIGMFGLTMAFFRLSIIKKDMSCGLATYARAGFGEFVGFNIAWGYWISAILADLAFVSLLFSSLSNFFPIFGEGTNLMSFVVASLIVWFYAIIVLMGVNESVILNVVIVAAKSIPIIVAVMAIVFAGAFDWDIFMDNFTGEGSGMSLFEQVKSTTFTTAWTFVGIEGAVVISGRGKTTKVGGQATVAAFLSLFVLYVIISFLSMGVMTNEELAALENPPLGGLLASVVGQWGAALVDIAVIISLGGALFTYTILNTDSCYGPAEHNMFPKIFLVRNKHNAPTWSIIITTCIVQFFLVVMFLNDATFQACYALSTAGIMIPYTVSALYYVKVVAKKEDLGVEGAGKSDFSRWFIAILAGIYGIWLLYSAGWVYWLVLSILYCPGTLLYLKNRKERGLPAFDKQWEKITAIALLVIAIVAGVCTATGTIAWF